ncbi:MAG: EAL domain-containing protein [Erythrobacter sp.]
MRLIGAKTITKGSLTRSVAFALALLIVIGACLGGFNASLESVARDGRDTLRIAPASGEIVILEIDGRSIQALEQWPWPREHYAKAVRELDRLGAEQIGFDVDFSSRSDAAGDQEFAAALSDLGGSVILPTFRQENHATDGAEITEALPLPELREHAFLASVNVFPDADGRILSYPYGELTNGIARPSLASMLAGNTGNIDEYFSVDQAIDPASFERISFVDLIEGNVSRAQIEGKRILVGATAIELGDRYPTSLFGVQAGVVIQAQAAETLLQDRVRGDSGPWLPMIILTVGMAILLGSISARHKVSIAAFIIGGVIITTALVFDQLAWAYIQLAPVVIFLISFVSIHRLLKLTLKLREARLTDVRSGLPNRRAMELRTPRVVKPVLAAMRIEDFEQIDAIVSAENLALLDQKIAERLALLAGSLPVFRLERGIFAWFVQNADQSDLAAHFSAARSVFNSPLQLGTERLKLRVHFGSSRGTIGEAENAAQFASQKGINWSSTSIGLHEEAQFQQKVLSEHEEAIENGEIYVVYQPKLRIIDGEISGAECLVRWTSPTLGEVSPADFIPILEDKGSINKLTKFVLRDAIKRTQEARTVGCPTQLAVNVSAQLLSDAEFVEEVIDMLKAAGPAEDCKITLEVTESAPLHDSEMAKRALSRFADAGARISIDDYGTGQATLNYLQDFPAQEIKLDQSFVRNLTENRADRIMVRSTIELAHALSFKIVAEGVEDADILSALVEFGCDYAQGWQIGRPMPWSEFFDVSQLGERGAAAA